MLPKGGPTGAGTKLPKAPKPSAWLHVCASLALEGGRELAGYWASCPDCGTRRP